MPDRPYDVVLFGATGFTGSLTAEYLARSVERGTVRWALAGRSRARLESVRDRLAELDTALSDLPLLIADAGDPGSLRTVAESARVVVSAVGPYIKYGEPLVAACAETGTDYLDITGEPEFVDLMYVRHHERAVASGARLVHSCGFDSIPHDLGAYYTVGLLPDDVAIRVDGYVRFALRPSGGTAHSAITAFSRGRKTAQAAAARRRLERSLGRDRDRDHDLAESPRRRSRVRARPPHLRRDLGWVLPLPSIDPLVVARSARALPRYGPDFGYSHHLAVKSLAGAVGLVAGAAGVFALAQLPPTRSWLLNRIQPGEGPTPEQRAQSWFAVRFVGAGGGRRVVTEVAGGDPGYDETAKMLAESALCLAVDDLPESAGQVTTAVAMGDALIKRLRRAGITFTTIAEDKDPNGGTGAADGPSGPGRGIGRPPMPLR